MSTRRFLSVILLSILVWSTSSRVRSLNDGSARAQNSNLPRLALKITDWWNAPVAINHVRIGKQEILPGSSFEATDDWAKNIYIESTNKSEKTISYVAYAIDFTVAGESSLYRLRLQDGNYYLSPDALTAANGLRVEKGQKHKMTLSDNAWGCQLSVVQAVNERKGKITKVELFVETVGYTDDTLWSFGSNLKHNKALAVFENVDYGRLAKGKNQTFENHAKGSLPKAFLKPYEPFACCVPVFTYITVPQGGRATQVNLSCSSCPPSSGGGSCPAPVPMKQVNSLNGEGNEAIQMTGFTQC